MAGIIIIMDTIPIKILEKATMAIGKIQPIIQTTYRAKIAHIVRQLWTIKRNFVASVEKTQPKRRVVVGH